ncbi:MAG: elongation factor Ts [Parcubacteria group bacterium]
MVSTDEIKSLREETGLSVMECRRALIEAEGDKEKALAILKAKGAAIAAKKGDRTLGSGAVVSYIHAAGNIGALVELSCETDFVGKNPEFKAVGYDIAMHIAAMKPEDVGELLDQPYIKDPSQKVGDLINGAVQKFGERTEIRRFVRYSVEE